MATRKVRTAVTSLPEVVGAVIQFHRRRKGESQEEVASVLGIGLSTYSRIEAGGTAVSILQLQDIGDHLGIRPSELLREAEETVLRLERDNPHLVIKRRREPRTKGGDVDYFAGAALGAVIGGVLATNLATAGGALATGVFLSTALGGSTHSPEGSNPHSPGGLTPRPESEGRDDHS